MSPQKHPPGYSLMVMRDRALMVDALVALCEIPDVSEEFIDENSTEVLEEDESEEEWLEEWLNESDEADENQHEDDGEFQSENVLSRKLRMWALSHRITHAALSDLLGIIRETTEYYVPMDARTFLKTPEQKQDSGCA
uniref:Uncharacterized protein n=1 Tax=Anopheles epiroticus TaxID=199890 RepID=A0A182PWN1_9DIPT